MKYACGLVAAVLIAGCAPVEAGGSSGADNSSISFETGACFGTCPVFSFTIDADGNGVFNGKRFVEKEGEHRFRASPAELAAFRARLARFRPDGEVRYDWENCSGPVMSDMPSLSIQWRDADGEDSLFWYQGCREKKLSDAKPDLASAWKELPLEELAIPKTPPRLGR